MAESHRHCFGALPTILQLREAQVPRVQKVLHEPAGICGCITAARQQSKTNGKGRYYFEGLANMGLSLIFSANENAAKKSRTSRVVPRQPSMSACAGP